MANVAGSKEQYFMKEYKALHKALEGEVSAYNGKITSLNSQYGYGVYLSERASDGVSIITNGGGGYGPLWGEFAIKGIADAVVYGELESAPNAYTIYEMGKKMDRGQGVLLLTNNYMGDYLNNDMALELLKNDGIDARAIYVTDDVCSSSKENRKNRGGLIGIIQLCKIASGAAADGKSLEQVYNITSRAMSKTASVSMLIHSESVEVGNGFSGEDPVKVLPYESVEQYASLAFDVLLPEIDYNESDSLYITVNRTRKVSVEEGFIIYNAMILEAKKRGMQMAGGVTDCYLDVYDRYGCILNLLAVSKEIKPYMVPVQGYRFIV